MIPPGKLEFFWTSVNNKKKGIDTQSCNWKYPIKKQKELLKVNSLLPKNNFKDV